jgi:hypothetical protein
MTGRAWVGLLFRRRFLSSPRPGKLGCEDWLGRYGRLAVICGLITVLLLGSAFAAERLLPAH